MVVLTGDTSKWYSCRVLYIGSAPPLETTVGIEAIQEPLNLRYPSDLASVEGIDSTLTVMPDRLVARYNESGQVVEYPLARLKICAAVRAVYTRDAATGETRRSFVPVNQIECDKDHPAVFSVILRRTQGRQIQECHSFICNSARDALHLVNATATANMALKKGQTVGEKTIVVQQNGYHSDIGHVNVAQSQPQNDIIYVRSTTEEVAPRLEPTPVPQMEDVHYTLRQPTVTNDDKDDIIYVGFDKTNLIKREDESLQVRPTTHEFRETRQQRMVVPAQRFQPQPTPAMAPIIVRAPPQPRMMYAPQPRPMLVGPPPPPPRPVIYGRRVMSPPPRFVAQPTKVHVRSRARSASPHRYGAMVRPAPVWRSHTSEIAGPPVGYRRMMVPMSGRSHMGYYGAHGAYGGFYDRPVTKSNPRYSSSSSSDGSVDQRYDHKRR